MNCTMASNIFLISYLLQYLVVMTNIWLLFGSYDQPRQHIKK